MVQSCDYIIASYLITYQETNIVKVNISCCICYSFAPGLVGKTNSSKSKSMMASET